MKLKKPNIIRELTAEDLSLLTEEEMAQLTKELARYEGLDQFKNLVQLTVEENSDTKGPLFPLKSERWYDLFAVGVYVAVRDLFRLYDELMRMGRLRKNTIRRPPGSHLNDLAAFIYYETTYLEVFRPVISDMQNEHFKALHKEQKGLARWAMVRGIFHFWITVVWHALSAIATLAKKIWTIAG